MKGDVAALARVLRSLEEQKRDVAAQLAEARVKAAHPLADSWGEVQSLAVALANAPDPEDARLRLRSVLRRLISEIRLLVIPKPKGHTRLAVAQIYFAGDGVRSYIIYHHPAHHSFAGHTPAQQWVKSLKELIPKDFDLRKPADALRLEALLLPIFAQSNRRAD